MEQPRGSVLLVDDDAGVREALSETLAEEGFSVHEARDGREALDWLHETAELPRVVLLDLMMPVMDGRTFLRLRQEDPQLAKVPVLVMTAGNGCGDIMRSHQVIDCLSKPIALPGLLAAIDACS